MMKKSVLLIVLVAASITLDAQRKAFDGHVASRPPLQKVGAFSPTGFSHKVGALWTQITNYGFYGDRAYAEPNFEWPGGSGNIYGWLTSIWVGGIVDSLGYISYGEGNHFTPLDTIRVKHRTEGSLSAEDTYTRYTDMNPPSPSGVHKNLGVEITERTYAWDQSYNGDFIISDYWIKYNVHDRNGDGKIDARDSTLTGVYVGFRMDADVSGFNGTSTPSTLWDQDDLVGYDSTNRTIYLYDGDSPAVAGDDTGNPDPSTGILRSPGYIGIRLLYSDSAHFVGNYTGRPASATPSYRNSEPVTSQAMYEYLKSNGIAPNAIVVRDWRGIMGIGPYRINAGDSIHVAIAWVIGNGLKGILANSRIAQLLFDGNYSKAASAPDVPNLTISTTDAGGQNAIALNWMKNAEQSRDPLTLVQDFAGYVVYRAARVDAGGSLIWDTLAVYPKFPLDPKRDTLWTGRPFVKSWPPSMVIKGTDTTYQFVDAGKPNGMIYTYAVTAFDKGDSTIGLGRLENQIGRGRASTQVYMANAAAAQTPNKIRVVPNPFMGASKLNNSKPVDTNPWVNRLRFVNLPPNSTINIFTLAGDLVKVIKSGDLVYRSRDVAITGDFSGVAEWDLISKNNQEVVSGTYIYVVESPAGTFTGKFVIMR
jgi:hypothetical protein